MASPSKSQKWSKFRAKFLKDKRTHEGYYVCESCNRWVYAITVDHKKKRSTHPELVFEPDNLQLLCIDCHDRKDSGLKYK